MRKSCRVGTLYQVARYALKRLCNGFAFLEKFLSCHGRSVVKVIRPENHTMSAPPSEAPRSPVAGEKRCASVEEGPGAFVRER